jgi:hypothetical protein
MGSFLMRNFGIPQFVEPDPDRDANHAFRGVILLLVGIVLSALVMLSACSLARAHDDLSSVVLTKDDGRYAAQDPALHAWFDKLASSKGLCCSFVDGVRVEDVDCDTAAPGGGYRVRLDGQWIVVPDAAVVTEPNKFGPAVVWPYTDEAGHAAGKIQIRCFLPGAGS